MKDQYSLGDRILFRLEVCALVVMPFVPWILLVAIGSAIYFWLR